MDKVTQLQEQLNYISRLFFDSIGTLQRDAPPINAKPKPVPDNQQQQQNGTIINDTNESIQKDSQNQQITQNGEVKNEMIDPQEDIKQKAISFGQEILKACSDFEDMLNQLPGADLSEEQQIQDLIRLEEENEIESKKLLETVKEAGNVLKLQLIVN